MIKQLKYATLLCFLLVFSQHHLNNDYCMNMIFNLGPKNVIIPPDDPEPYFEDIELNSINNISLSNAEIACYKYTPATSMFFVLETFGTKDTIIKIEGTENGTIIDDDSGQNYNSRIRFKAIANHTLYIYAKLYFNNDSGNFNLQLRKQYFSMFAYEDDEGNSTIPDLIVPYNQFSSIFETKKYENGSSSQALSPDERLLGRINSEVMFFSGHGYKDNDNNKGYGVAFKTGGITTSTSLNMEETNVAVWAACYSANATNYSNMSIAEYSVVSGAKSALGFREEITFSSSRIFTNNFFTRLSEGYSINQSALFASYCILWPWDTVKQYTIFGDNTTIVTASTVSNGNFTTLPFRTSQTVDEFVNGLDGNYLICELSDNNYRIYKKINGFLTNSFIDVQTDGHLIKFANDLRVDPGHVYPIVFNDDLMINNLIFNLFGMNATRTEEHIVYFTKSGRTIPILISTCVFDYFGTTFEENICVNLYDKTIISYKEISEVICQLPLE